MGDEELSVIQWIFGRVDFKKFRRANWVKT